MPMEELPPFGLRGWPADALAHPYPVYRRYRERSSVHHVPGAPGEPDTYYVFGYDEVAKALADPRLGRSREVASGAVTAHRSGAEDRAKGSQQTLHKLVQNWLVFMDPPRHTTLRSRLSKEFTPRVVVALRDRIAAIADELLTELRQKETIDLVDAFSAPFPVMVICELLGVPRQHRDWLRERALRLQEANSSRTVSGTDGHSRADTAARDLGDFFLEHAEQRRHRGTDDLISLLVRRPDGAEPLTDDEITATCVHLLTAGHETTTHTLSKSVLALLDRPGTLAELRAAPSLLTDAVRELIRFDAPVQAVSRWAYQDHMLGDQEIRRGAKLVLLLGSANRDPRRFHRPDELDIHRPADRHLGFGLGIHHCLGSVLARTEVEIGLAAMLEFLSGVSLTGRPVPYADDLIFHGPEHLMLRTSGRLDSARALSSG